MRVLPPLPILHSRSVLRSGPLLKIGATTAALLCAGSAAFVGPVGSDPGSPVAAAPALDHYLCVPGHGGDCRSVAVTLPNGTTAAVGDPDARLDCDRVRWGHGSRHHRDGETVEVTNALSPEGPDGSFPVALVSGRVRWTCALTSPAPVTARVGRRSPPVAPTVLALFACVGVEYPSRDPVRFASPTGVWVGDHLRVDVRRPLVLCLPTDTGVAATSDAGANALVCFDTRVRWWWGPQLCVPSSTDGSPPPVGTPGPTTGSTSTTTSSTTTTTPTTSSTSTTSTTTSSTTTSTTTSSTTTTTTTTTTPTSQPCAGVIINGVCVINL